MSSLIAQAQAELSAFDHDSDPHHLRVTATRLATVNLLLPADPGDRLELRRQTLALWLALMTRLDKYIAGLRLPVAGDKRSDRERNRLFWQCELVDREATALAQQFIQRYYTGSPVDIEELQVVLSASDLSNSHRALLFD